VTDDAGLADLTRTVLSEEFSLKQKLMNSRRILPYLECQLQIKIKHDKMKSDQQLQKK